MCCRRRVYRGWLDSDLGSRTHRRARNRIHTAAHRCTRDGSNPCKQDRICANSWTGDYAPLADVRALLLRKLFSVSLRTRPVRVAHNLAKVEPHVMRNFTPALPRLELRYDGIEALPRGFGQ